MSHSLTPIDESLFPKCSPSIKNKLRHKKKKVSSSSPSSSNTHSEDHGRKKEVLVELLVDINEEGPSPDAADLGIAQDNTMEDSSLQHPPIKQLDLYGSSFPLPSSSCEASSSSSGASSIASSTKDPRRILSEMDSKSPHRDTKIEIAGGREIFCQSKTRSGRTKRSSSKHLGKRPSEVDPCSSTTSGPPPRHPSTIVTRGGHQVLRETVFSSEIHSIEYHRPLVPLYVDEDEEEEEEFKQQQPQVSAPDVNVTYDLIDGVFSPPSGLVVRSAEDELPHTQDLLSHTPTGEADYVDNLYLGEEAYDASKKQQQQQQSVMIGGVKIAEYEGSPRRYRPRLSSSPPSKTTKASAIRRKVGSSASSSTTSSTSSLSGLRSGVSKLPGFPQRILPPQEDAPPQPGEPSVVHHPSQPNHEEEELLKFEEVPPPQIEKEPSPSTEYDSRYEFSETRKVLDEFFKENSPSHPATTNERDEEFGELDYTLKRRQATNESYVGHRLASTLEEGGGILPNHSNLNTTNNNDVVGTLISPSNVNDDLLCSSVVPIVGLSPLDPSSSIPSSIQNGYYSNSSSSNPGGTIPSPEILSNGGVENASRHLLDDQNGLENSRNFTLSPETTDCDSADLESEVSANEGSINSSAARIHLPVLEDGLSSGHASDLEDDVIYSSSGNVLLKKPNQQQQVQQQQQGGGGVQQPQHFSESVMGKDSRRHPNHHLHQQQQPLSNHNIIHHSNSHLIPASLLHHPHHQQHSKAASLSNNHLNSTTSDILHINNNNNNIINNNNSSSKNYPLGPFNQSNNGTTSSSATTTTIAQVPSLGNTVTSAACPPPSTHNIQHHLPPSTPIAHETQLARKNELGFALEPSLNHKTDSSSFPSTNSIIQSSLTSSTPGSCVKSSSSSSKLSVAAADESVAAALKDIKKAIQAARVLQSTRIPPPPPPLGSTPEQKPSEEHPQAGIVDPWILRQNANPTPPLSNYDPSSPDNSCTHPSNSSSSSNSSSNISSSHSTEQQQQQSGDHTGGGGVHRVPNGAAGGPLLLASSLTASGGKEGSPSLGKKNNVSGSNGQALPDVEVDPEEDEPEVEEDDDDPEEEEEEGEEEEETESEIGEERVPTPKNKEEDDLDTDQETDRLLGQQYNDDNGYYDTKNEAAKKKTTKSKEALSDPKVLIEGVLFRARYLGSTQLVCEGQPTKATRMMQAEEAVSRIKAPDGENQPSTEVDLFISTEKIMVLNTDLKEIMMDHALRSISYIADIGDILVIMARRRIIPSEGSSEVIGSTPKMICHVFESEEAQFIAQSIGQAFQVAYMEFLKANGIEDHSFVKEMDYQEVLNSQEIFGDELAMFAKKELQKEVVVPKTKGEILGVVIVESGWGSMLPTIVLANLSPTGPAARCGHLNIGDQIIAINGISLVGLPLSTCQHYIKNTKNKTAVKLTAVSCAPVVEVKIKRPDTKYQLGFSVQNGVICSLLRGGIAERGGVRVGHRIIEINGQSVVAVPHERIVNLLATSVGEITMKTMPTSMFRLLTGQETPLYI